ncbi:MAG: phosphotransferase [Planctomycetota bacterium]
MPVANPGMTPREASPILASPIQSSLGSALGESSADRTKYMADELAIVLSHYDLGVIDTIHEFPRGSRRAPKILLRTDKGVYLLKRRARGKDDPFKVAFCHQLQMFLAEKQFPLPHLIGTKNENNSMLQLKGHTYEVFEYIKGTGYDNSLEATGEAGKTLGLFHKLARKCTPDYEPSHGSYHAAKSVQNSLRAVPGTLAKVDPVYGEGQSGEVSSVTRYLHNSYNEAAQRVNELGLPDWPMQIIHSDWHPGNMLFRKKRVVAVIDYDAARLQQRIIDTANGALQFSILGGGDDAAQWPDYLDESRYKRFLRGYDSINVLSRSELLTVPWLMIEALIAEAVIPIAATGSFARMEGFDFLRMVERKVRWLQANTEKLATILGN